MILMAVMGVMLIAGIVLAVRWGGAPYEPWEPQSPSTKTSALRYLRGLAVALVAGFWTGALVTGPAVRLIMRLLAVTAGDDAQGRVTEAEEIVGRIEFDGTLGLYIFGGLLPGLLSGAIYVVFRRWLPSGRLGGVVFGVLHLVIAATRIDPLRPENPDFDIVGPGWLSVVTFALASVLHGMAIAAIANRYSRQFPPRTSDRSERARAVAPLVLPALLLVPGVTLLVPILLGLIIAVLVSKVGAAQSPLIVLVGRIVVIAAVVLLLPGTVTDLRDVIDRPPVSSG